MTYSPNKERTLLYLCSDLISCLKNDMYVTKALEVFWVHAPDFL